MPTAETPEPEPTPEPAPPIVVSDQYKGLLDDLDRPKVAWRPSPGDAVIGKVVAMMTATSEYADYPLLTLDPGPDSPLVDVHAFHTWLKSDIVRLNVREGDIFGVKFLDVNGPRNAARYRTSLKRTGSGDPYQLGANLAAVPGTPVQQAMPMDDEPF
jgi:hypothetical protein